MGVMSCSRPDCESIMCHTYVNGVGYVCRECQTEFEKYVNGRANIESTNIGLKNALVNFMDTDKGSYETGIEMDVNEFFKSYEDDGDI